MIGFLQNKNLKYIKIRTDPNDRIIIAQNYNSRNIIIIAG